MAIVTDTVEGVINQVLWYHYDIANDVLYLRYAADRETATYGEETTDGVLVLRRQNDEEPVGLTVVNWWKRFGTGARPDSIHRLETQIEPWAARVAA